MNQTDFHPDHLADLRRSGLSDEIIEMMRVYSARPADIPALVGFNPQRVESALAFPYPNVSGFCRLKVFPAYEDGEGRKVKYLQRKGSGAHLYVLPAVQTVLKNPSVSIYVVEGEKKNSGGDSGGTSLRWNWRTLELDQWQNRDAYRRTGFGSVGGS